MNLFQRVTTFIEVTHLRHIRRLSTTWSTFLCWKAWLTFSKSLLSSELRNTLTERIFVSPSRVHPFECYKCLSDVKLIKTEDCLLSRKKNGTFIYFCPLSSKIVPKKTKDQTYFSTLFASNSLNRLVGWFCGGTLANIQCNSSSNDFFKRPNFFENFLTLLESMFILFILIFILIKCLFWSSA